MYNLYGVRLVIEKRSNMELNLLKPTVSGLKHYLANLKRWGDLNGFRLVLSRDCLSRFTPPFCPLCSLLPFKLTIRVRLYSRILFETKTPVAS
jgi:hypothetical protein